ncbi:uncharacterized protein F5147DRAFT_780946 [Suillus discolor]|uniref:Uncharacterized protein n=1 Tax=Suillus discolor TaxID=1912936 RepID=A0A9P7JLV0_9AGAM|nr:uncharacterized protein F5147DRAFT_780946 [Suillus discolor]KAG2088552.1 hypothetical protein F5147DRAFT_780946 [Suillus discolor]
MAKSTRHASSSQDGPSHVRQGAELQGSEQLDDGSQESKGLRRKKKVVLIISDDEEVDEEGLGDGSIDDVPTYGRPEDMPSHIPLGAPLQVRYTAQDIAPGFMKAVMACTTDVSFVRWYCDIAEGVGCSHKCHSNANPLQCTQCAQKDIKCRYPISENSSQRELRCIPCGKGRVMDCSWSQDLRQAYLREAYQLDVGEARVLASSTDDDPQATLAAYYQVWRTDPATHILDDNVRLSLRKVQRNMGPGRVTRSKLIGTSPTPPPPPPSTPASTRPKLKGSSHTRNDLATPHRHTGSAASAGPLPSHMHRNSSDVASSDRLTPPLSTTGPLLPATPTASAGPLRLQVRDSSITATSSRVNTERAVSHYNVGGRLPNTTHALADAQVDSTHAEVSPATDILSTRRPVLPHLSDLPGEAAQGLDQFLKSVLGSTSSTNKSLQEKIFTLEAELQQVKSELEAEKALRLTHTLDGDKTIADQHKTIAERDKIIADQQRTIANLSRNVAKMDVCSQAARRLISGQLNPPSGMLVADAAPSPGGQYKVTTTDVKDFLLTLLPTISSRADREGRWWVEHLCSLVQGTSPPIKGKRSVGEISGSAEGSDKKSQAKRRKQAP